MVKLKSFGKLLIALLIFLFTLSGIGPVSAYGQWVDCVVVSSAGLSPYPYFGSPAYEVSVSNGCQGDMGGVTLEFNSGSFDVWESNRESIWSLGSWNTTKTFTLENIKPGFYYPTLTITATKDYSTRRMNLPSYSIQAPAQPTLGSYGGTATLPNNSYQAKQICTSSAKVARTCSTYPNWTYSICSTNPSGVLQEKVGANWVKLWNFKGTKNTSCTSKYPYSILIEGSSTKKTGTTTLRLAFTKTSSYSAFYDTFQLTLP